MKLYNNYDKWNALCMGASGPSVRWRSGVSERLAPLPYLHEYLKLHARAWLQLLNSHPAFAEYVQHCRRLLHKIYRPYLTAHLGTAERLAMLASHYQFIFRHGLGQTVAQAASCGVVLASIEGKTGTRYPAQLRAVEPLEHEGELVLQLVEGGALAYSTAFTFSDLDGFCIVSVGC